MYFILFLFLNYVLQNFCITEENRSYMFNKGHYIPSENIFEQSFVPHTKVLLSLASLNPA